MTDLELTKLCAEAMGIDINFESRDTVFYIYHPIDEVLPLFKAFAPLHDDAQAMALVKKFGLWLELNMNGWDQTYWRVTSSRMLSPYYESEHKEDLNRAICECVAKMHGAHERSKAA